MRSKYTGKEDRMPSHIPHDAHRTAFTMRVHPPKSSLSRTDSPGCRVPSSLAHCWKLRPLPTAPIPPRSQSTAMNNAIGSPQSRLALATLATALCLDVIALKTALEAAFDLLPSVQNPGLALHMTLARHGYRIDSETFYAALSALCRSRVAATLQGQHGKEEGAKCRQNSI